VIARDRAGAYAEGARLGAAQAIQVADRWHLLRNLGDAVQGAVDRHRTAVHQAVRATVHGPSEPLPTPTVPAHSTTQTRMLADRLMQRRARYEELHRLKLTGLSAEKIAPALGMSAIVVRRWLRAGGPPAHSKPRQVRPLDLHLAFLKRRWSEGCRNASQLWRELSGQGFTGSRGPVARWVAHRRRENPPPDAAAVHRAATWPAPSSRRCARLLTVPADTLDSRERTFLSCLGEIAPDLIQTGTLAMRFASLVRAAPDPGSKPTLNTWLLDAKGSLLDSFVRGIQRDYNAVLAGLVEPWSNGQVESQVNRLKLLKRSMYGRAGYDLLRHRVLVAA
jgi:transposase